MPTHFSDKDIVDDFKSKQVVVGGRVLDVIMPDRAILIDRRHELGLTQQQVANRAGIQLMQYQRFERGERSMASASFRIGMAICDVLKLDPHRFVGSCD